MHQSAHRSPEGLTSNQETLAAMLFDTKTIAPVNRRRISRDGTISFYKIERPTSPVDSPVNDEEFVLKLHETNPNAPLSPIYINLRNLPDAVLDQVGIVMAEMDSQVTPDVTSGIPKAGTPLANAYEKYSGVKLIEVFKKEETEKGRRIVAGGQNGNGQKLRIIDDLATRGHSKIEAIKAAESVGFEVVDIFVIVDRQQGAVDELREMGYILKAAFTIGQLLGFGVRTKRITKEQFTKVTQYLHK